MKEGFVHDTACVEPGAVVGREVKIWHHAHVRERALIGAQTVIGKGAYVDAGVRIGERCKIQNGAQLFSGTTLGEGVFVGPGAILTNDLHPRAVRPDGTMKTAEDWSLGRVSIGDGASIGAGAVIVTGVVVGRWAMVGAGAVVTRDVADHSLVLGVPAKAIAQVCFCGRPVVGACTECGWATP